VAGNLYVETNAKGFMSVNGNTGIYGNVVLTLRLQFRPSRFNRVRFLRVLTRCVDSDRGVGVVIYMWTEMRTWLGTPTLSGMLC
jgi:hypothetical protein